jgi:hypothetical protein
MTASPEMLMYAFAVQPRPTAPVPTPAAGVRAERRHNRVPAPPGLFVKFNGLGNCISVQREVRMPGLRALGPQLAAGRVAVWWALATHREALRRLLQRAL